MRYTDEQLLDFIREYNNLYGFPTQRDFNKISEYPNHVTYYNRFGSFQNAIIKAGINIPDDMKKLMNRNVKHDKSEVLNELKVITLKYLETSITLPSYETIEKMSEFITESMIYRMFGDLKSAYKLIGYEEDYNDNAIKEDMIDKYYEIYDTIGRVPNSRDIERFSRSNNRYYAMTTYINRFGNLRDVEKLLDVDGNCKTRNMTKNDIINGLIKLNEELGDVPMQQDINDCKYLPNIHRVLKVLKYSGMGELQKELFGETYCKTKITKNGTRCLSQYEYTIASILEKYGYDFIKDAPYKNYININKRLTVDFVILKNDTYYFIEIFGITGNEKYDRKTETKISLCENNGIPLLKLYPKDFYYMNQKKWLDLINNFINK